MTPQRADFPAVSRCQLASVGVAARPVAVATAAEDQAQRLVVVTPAA